MFCVATHLKKAKHLDVLIDFHVTLMSQIKGVGIY